MFIVGIDAGHGGSNTGVIRGTQGFDQIVEKDYNLLVAKEVISLLHGTKQITGTLLRSCDQNMSLGDRDAKATELSADFILSIHCNASPDPHVRGLMAFYWPGNHRTRWVSEALTKASPEALSRRKNAVISTAKGVPWKKDARAVVGAYRAPCVLAEIGHVTNSEDRRYLLKPYAPLAVANCLVAGIIKAFELKEESIYGV